MGLSVAHLPKEQPVTEPLRLDENELTIGDLEDFESITGQTFESLRPGKDGSVAMDAKMLKALVFIVKRRADPAFTLDDARDVRVTELEVVPVRKDPTPAAG